MIAQYSTLLCNIEDKGRNAAGDDDGLLDFYVKSQEAQRLLQSDDPFTRTQ